VLAGGIAFFAFFSLFPALALGFTVFGLVVDGDSRPLRRVADGINKTFGNQVIGTRPGQGIWTMDQLSHAFGGDVLTVTGLVGLVILFFSGLGWVGALRDGVSAVFGRRTEPQVIVAKSVDLAVLAVFGLSVLASLVGGVLVSSATGPVLDWLGTGRSRGAGVLVNVLTALLLLVIDALLFLLLFRVLSGVRPALDDVWTGALAGAVGMGLLKLGGSYLLRVTSGGNRFAAAASIVVGLLVWMSLAARLVLIAAAWAATTVEDNGRGTGLPVLVGAAVSAGASAGVAAGAPTAAGGPAGVPAPRPSPSAPVPTYSDRAADRTTLAAGAVLGATAAIGLRVLGEAARVLRGRPG
jgi:membrane protein